MTAINSTRLDRKRKLTRYAIREHGGNILFMLPAFALFAFVVLVPFIQSIPVSFTDKRPSLQRAGISSAWKTTSNF